MAVVATRALVRAILLVTVLKHFFVFFLKAMKFYCNQEVEELQKTTKQAPNYRTQQSPKTSKKQIKEHSLL